MPAGERVEANDIARGTRRIGVISGDRLAAALFVTRTGTLPERDWLIAQLSEAGADANILAGRGPGVGESQAVAKAHCCQENSHGKR